MRLYWIPNAFLFYVLGIIRINIVILCLGYIQDILFYGLDISRTFLIYGLDISRTFLIYGLDISRTFLIYGLDISRTFLSRSLDVNLTKHVADIIFFRQFCHKKKIHFLFSVQLELFGIREKFSCISDKEKGVLASGIR